MGSGSTGPSASGPDGSEGIEARLRRGLRSLDLPEDAAPSMARYAALLEERNAVMDLTAVTGEAEIASLHFLDSAAVLTAGIPLSGRSLIDVGSGAGFPGIPLRLIDPTIRLSLLDARRKRVEFLDEVCAALDLPDVIRIHGRAEELGASGGPYREAFDAAVSRAVAAMPILAELCLPLVRTGGVFLAMKSVHCGEELDQARPAIGILGGEIERIWDYPVPDTDAVHRLIAIRKIRPTPDGYPRPFARMKKRPLGGTARRSTH